MLTFFVLLLIQISLVGTFSPETIVKSKVKRAVSIFSETSQDFRREFHSRKKRSEDGKSHIFLDNRSGKTVRLLYWRKRSFSKTPSNFTTLGAHQSIAVETNTGHEWIAVDNRGRRLLIGDRKQLTPKANNKANRSIYLIKNPGQTKTDIGDRYIELLVIMDKSAASIHKTETDAKRYVITLLRLATQAYQLKDLLQHGVKIHLVLSKLIVLRRDLDVIKLKPDDNEKALIKVCSYMNSVVKRDRYDRYDHKLFLTKQEFGRGGFANTGAMCSPNSCSIVNDYGFLASFLVAHEIAHGFYLTDKSFGQRSGLIMSGIVDCVFGKCGWSVKSQIEMLTNIRKFRCVINKPRWMPNLPTVHKYPGVYYTMSRQCHFFFNEDYTVKIRWNRDPCSNLECRMPPPNSAFSRPLQSPVLDGTDCGKNKWCLSGRCTSKTEDLKAATVTRARPTQPKRVKEGWKEWNPWSKCSRTCNTGIQTRTRDCFTTSQRRVKIVCIGDGWQIRTCYTRRTCATSDRDDVCIKAGRKLLPGRKWQHGDNTKGKYDCTFEKDMCLWKNKDSSSRKWTLNRGSTPSSGTGPSTDYTLKTAKGQYLYFESSTPSKARAILMSPFIYYRKVCLSFSYHMWGDDNMGQLKLIKNSRGKNSVLWIMRGNKGKRWYRHNIDIQTNIAYQLSFLAKKKRRGFRSDIAIDDIKIKLGKCPSAQTRGSTPCRLTCTTADNKKPAKRMNGVIAYDGTSCLTSSGSNGVCYRGECKNVGCDNILTDGKNEGCSKSNNGQKSSNTMKQATSMRTSKTSLTTQKPTIRQLNDHPISCNFDRNFCQWRNLASRSRQNVYGNDVNWFRQRDKGKGYFLRIRQTRNGGLKTGSINSPEVNEPIACLRFHYKLGRQGGRATLRVKLAKKYGRYFGSSIIRFIRKSERWQEVKIDIQTNRIYKIIFEAHLPGSYTGLIAIDNIHFEKGKCTGKK